MSKLENKKHIEKTCRICYQSKSPFYEIEELISPCKCKGTIEFVHKSCLKLWHHKASIIRKSMKCEQCKQDYNMNVIKSSNRFLTHLFSIMFIGSIMIVTKVLVYLVIFAIEGPVYYSNFSTIGIQNNFFYEFYQVMGIVAFFYQFIFSFQLLSQINFLFTVWRIAQFSFFIDKIILMLLSIHALVKMYSEIYSAIDYYSIFFLNHKLAEIE